MSIFLHACLMDCALRVIRVLNPGKVPGAGVGPSVEL